jgi:formate dehydrogenase iron-sulfur subunit
MTARYAFSIDLDRCIGCQACVVACRTGNEIPSGETFITVTDLLRKRENSLWGSFAHHRCFHCGAAPCVSVCPTGTLSKWNGITAVEAERCSGCGYCTDACPFKVPHVRDNQVEKCLGCLDQVKDGQTPWCVQTCPNQAIGFGERDAILAEAHTRVDGLRARYPDAQVYGESQLGGLGLILVLLDRPTVYGLPERPKTPAVLEAWQAVQPAATGLTAAAAVAMGLMFVVAWRRHVREQEETHRVEGTSQPSEAGAADEVGHD